MISEYFNIDKLRNDVPDFTEDDMEWLCGQIYEIVRIINKKKNSNHFIQLKKWKLEYIIGEEQ